MEVSLTCSYFYDGKMGGSCNFYQAELYSHQEASFAVSETGQSESHINISGVLFKSSSIYSVPASIFTYFPNLTELHLSGSKVQEIRNNSFENATKLLLIDLSHNRISALGPDTFKGATNLQNINLSNNQLSYIDVNAFRGLPNLIILSLDNNNIKYLSANVFSTLTKLSYLNLGYNSIESLHKDIFRNMTNLGHLDLSHNYLETWEDTLFLDGIQLYGFLDLSFNRIKSLGIFGIEELQLNLNMLGNICADAHAEFRPYVRVRYGDSDFYYLDSWQNPYEFLYGCYTNG
jgi:hypothetical protein